MQAQRPQRLRQAVRRVTGAVLIALVVLPAGGQVRRSQEGSELDANYRVGSGGRNIPITPQRIDSQLYVNGQVSGLGSFQGRVGYFPADELRLNLPSAQLGDFRRQSVGLSDIVRGNPFAPSPPMSLILKSKGF